jgi:hypothetical protein
MQFPDQVAGRGLPPGQFRYGRLQEAAGASDGDWKWRLVGSDAHSSHFPEVICDLEDRPVDIQEWGRKHGWVDDKRVLEGLREQSP